MIAEHSRRDAVKDYFSARSQYWESLYAHPESGRGFIPYELLRRKDIVFSLISGIRSSRHQSVLDLACGAGHYLAQLSAMGFECTGVDISEEMLDLTRKRLDSQPASGARLIQADCSNVPVADHSVDLITCIGLLEYLNDETEPLREIKRMLAPGGFAVVTFPNLFKLRNLVNPYYYLVRIWTYLFKRKASPRASGDVSAPDSDFEFCKSTVRRYSLRNVRKLVAGAGFRIVEIKSCCFGPFSLWKKNLLPLKASIRISNALEGIANRKRFGFGRFFANRWVLLIQPEPPGGAPLNERGEAI